jgi:hypothetical protein
MPFPAFWGEILCMERVRDEEKINETTPDDYFNIINVTFTENLI